jgi:hypothetical protein
MFSRADYDTLHRLVFRSDYPGYKPTVIEIPNGDGKADAEKKYSHVGIKYFANDWQRFALMPYLQRAYDLAVEVAVAGGVPAEYMPDINFGALRVLDYPPGAISHKHLDFSLFTVMLYRDDPSRFHAIEEGASEHYFNMKNVNPQVHIGELGAEVGLGPATPHEVFASTEIQRSIVYFAIPSWDVKLPSGVLVKDFLNERMARSRTEFKKYE